MSGGNVGANENGRLVSAWLRLLGALVGAAMNRDLSAADHLDQVNAAHAALFAVLTKQAADVAELIDADREYNTATERRTHADNRLAAGDRSDDSFRTRASAHHAYDRAADRRCAALAAFRGEA